jgi:hypothetical protein
MAPLARLGGVSLDSEDPKSLAAFWCDLPESDTQPNPDVWRNLSPVC